MTKVLVLATLATKAEEANFLLGQLEVQGVTAQVIDTSLASGGEVLDGTAKITAMFGAAERAIAQIEAGIKQGAEVVVGIGGGTGGEIALQVMRTLPITFPKVLCTTLPFDPRYPLADNSIVIVPTLADLCGLNALLRDALENTALIAAGLCRKLRKGELTELTASVGITALGATDGAIKPLVSALAGQGREATVFHSNGFGGAAFARCAARGAFDAIVDLTPHELTRMHLAGAHVPMPDRFSAGSALPRVVLPGALNFIGLGEKSLLPPHYLERPHYAHSSLFTHVKATIDEMAMLAAKLADALNALAGRCAVLVPMGGFSHHDRPGGAIEDPELREVCAEVLIAKLNDTISVTRLDAHLFAPQVTEAIIAKLTDISA